MLLVNLTPHSINVNGNSIPSDKDSYTIPRVDMNRTQVNSIHGIPIYNNVIGEVKDLPVENDGVFYIVSALVRLACPHRKDLLSPGNLIRDNDGNIIGCDGFDSNQ